MRLKHLNYRPSYRGIWERVSAVVGKNFQDGADGACFVNKRVAQQRRYILFARSGNELHRLCEEENKMASA